MTTDGVAIDAVHLAGDEDLAIVLAHGFTLHWQRAVGLEGGHRAEPGAAGSSPSTSAVTAAPGARPRWATRRSTTLTSRSATPRELGYQRVATVGFSMGASIVLRHAALIGGADAVVSVSGPGRWYYRGTRSMRKVHWAVEHRLGRLVARTLLHTKISSGRWDPVPMPPAEAAARIAPTPLLIVHGDLDGYFPVDHARAAVRGGARTQGAVDRARLRPRRVRGQPRPAGADRRLGPRGRARGGQPQPRLTGSRIRVELPTLWPGKGAAAPGTALIGSQASSWLGGWVPLTGRPTDLSSPSDWSLDVR